MKGNAMNQIKKVLSSENGDIPGWVLITVMTAGLVTALWTVADDHLVALFSKALSAISAR
jgi:hypothetical protein